MVIAFSFRYYRYSTLLEEIIGYACPLNAFGLSFNPDAHILTETTRIIVPDGLSITK